MLQLRYMGVICVIWYKIFTVFQNYWGGSGPPCPPLVSATVTTGTFTSVGPLLAPVVKHDFQMNWALLIASASPLISSHILDIPSYKSQNRQGRR